MEIIETDIADVKLIRPQRICDERGFFSETHRSDLLMQKGIPDAFVQDNHSLSVTAGTLRGLHFQIPPRAQAKIIRVIRGAILDVAVDIRPSSPNFGRHVGVELSADNWLQLYIPIGFAHGFISLTPNTEVVYKVTDYYSSDHDKGILWCDPDLAIAWPLNERTPVLSPRDRDHPLLRDCPSYF